MDTFCELAYAIDFHGAEPMLKKRMLRNATRSGMRRILRRVQFTEPAVPSRLWWFRAHELLESEHQPRAEQLIPLNPMQFYFHEFLDCASEHLGLAWDWVDD